MDGWFHLLQLGFGLFVIGVLAERARALFWLAPTSSKALKWLIERLRQGDAGAALAWARLVPRAHVARVLINGLTCPPAEARLEIESERADLAHSAASSLNVLRVSATMASATGLLGGILALRHGFGGGAGLLALQKGLAQQVAVSDALLSMALGVGMSATCFYALGLFRAAARDLIAQTTQIAHLLADIREPSQPKSNP